MRAFRLAYDGLPFHGFQRQPDVPTVEGALFAALESLGVANGEPAGYSAAGRTDAGVSAIAQTVAFEAPSWCSPSALNSSLPETVRAWAHADTPPAFHATTDARRRTYCYHLHAPAADPELARAAARELSGEHDFHDLTVDDRGTVRRIAVSIDPDGDFLVISVRSDGFPRGLVRRLVSLIARVADGSAPLAKVHRVLGPDPIEGPAGIPAAPAYPLVLVEVAYDRAFAMDDQAATEARAVFEDRRVELATRSRVAGALRNGLERPASGDR